MRLTTLQDTRKMSTQLNEDSDADDSILVLVYRSLKYSISIPVHLRLHALRTKDVFLAYLSTLSSEVNDVPPSSESELLLCYMSFLITHHKIQPSGTGENNKEFIELILREFEDRILDGVDIHQFAASLACEESNKLAIIRTYYDASIFTRQSPRCLKPGLFGVSRNRDEPSIYVVFGGQGNTEHYFDELRTLHATYAPLLSKVLLRFSDVLNLLSTDLSSDRHYCQGIDFMSWLSNPASTPSTKYLLSAPISFPLIGLIQLAHYYVLCSILGLQPGEFLSRLMGMTGHSQGIVVATALATANTWEEFEDAAESALKILFFIGYRSQQSYSESSIPQKIIQAALEKGDSMPTPMLNVMHLSQSQLQHHTKQINLHLPDREQVEIALVNGRKNFVVVGPSLSLHGLNIHLQGLKGPEGQDQSQIPFKTRKPHLVTRFLPVTVPFHSSYLNDAAAFIDKDLKQHNVFIKPSNLKTSVYHTKTGENLEMIPEADLCPIIVRMITADEVNWPKSTVFQDATHVLDFGPGGTSGVGTLLLRNKEGQGARVILATLIGGTNSEFGYRPEIFDSWRMMPEQKNWSRDYGPRLLKDISGKIIVDTKFSRLLGLPPLMIAGMTPTTVPYDFVAVSMNAGYHIEMASGGYFDEKSLTEAVSQLQSAIPVGRGITINLIYSNPRAIQWQIPCIQKCQASGHCIEGITFGAGVPSVDIATEYIQTLGLKHISFKPGSVDAIKQVISIARANPNFPVLLQWTGGRGGGHHSYEDFHEPILQMYGRIRNTENIIIIAGSGFGGTDDTYPYITGSWSRAFGYPDMPFDACLLGSRIMVAKEAHTSTAAKEVIAHIEGLSDKRWQETYEGAAGGVITVKSEMGQPIHKVATRGVQLWAELDRKIFKLEKKQQMLELNKQRNYIICRLNKDFQKVWFGRNKAGESVDLKDMTYAEVLQRLVELLYVKHQSRWIDESYIRLVSDFIKRLEERLVTSTIADKTQQFYKDYELQKPENVVDLVLKNYASADRQLLTAEDVQFFLLLCQRRNQKPVPFIPILDENFETWFKKDSLWQSEDIEAVVDRDIQRTCILHGPLAAQHSTLGNINQPVKVILDNIHDGHIRCLLRDLYCGSIDAIPFVEYFGGHVLMEENVGTHNISETSDGKKLRYSLPTIEDVKLPSANIWFRVLAGESKCWRHALFMSDKIVQGELLVTNPIRRIFAPKHGICVEVSRSGTDDCSIVMKEAVSQRLLVEIETEITGDINVFIKSTNVAMDSPASLKFSFSYHPTTPESLIHEIMNNRNDRIKSLYRQLWIGDEKEEEVVTDLSIALMHGEPSEMDDNTIKEFIKVIGMNDEEFFGSPGKVLMGPMDCGIIIAWKAIMKALLLVDGDLLRLVHLSNKFKMLSEAAGFATSRNYDSTARINAIIIQDSGKMVEICATITDENVPVMEVTSQFLYRGEYRDFSDAFQYIIEPEMKFHPTTATQVALLISKDWYEADGRYPHSALLGQDLIFRLQTHVTWETKNTHKSFYTTGRVLVENSVTRELVEVATINCRSRTPSTGPNAVSSVIDFLRRHGSVVIDRVDLERPIPLGNINGTSFIAPASNEAYSRVSKDHNPIHVSDIFARYANLPGTITHGMHTSAIIRGICNTWCIETKMGRMKSYQASFCGMVLPGDEIEVVMQHTAMRKGRRVIAVEARNKMSAEMVVVAECEIEEGCTAYFFTGQGSQELKMGMDLYETSKVARDLWDRADHHFDENYGFKISEIVKHNPKKLTVHFGGQRGANIRQNYLRMTYEFSSEDGTKAVKNIFGIDRQSRSYTYYSATGLLNSTEFTQPALAIMEKAIYDDMMDKNLIIHGAKFAGHSLGEFSALAAVANIMPLERLLSVVFYRGLSMRVSVKRDESGRSNFAMMAINPTRISKDFGIENLQKLIQLIQTETKSLLEIVNYNVELQQYVCAGELQALSILTHAANHIHDHPESFASLTSLITADMKALAQQKEPVSLQRGKATIPLAGIDVPFHSSFLMPHLSTFREVLLKNIDQLSIDPRKLVGQYIPNVTARPFEITKGAFENAYQITKSDKLRQVLDDWETKYTDSVVVEN